MTAEPMFGHRGTAGEPAPGPLGWCAMCLAQGRYHPASTLREGSSLCEGCLHAGRPSRQAAHRVAQRLPESVTRRLPGRIRGQRGRG